MKVLKKYVKTHIDRLERRLDEFVRFEETEKLHQVRVEIKKIKAFLLVAGRSIKGFNAHREFIPFREIFRQAGAIREPEVNAALATHYGIEPGQHLNTFSETHKEIFLLDAPVFIHRLRKNRNKLTKLAKGISKKDCIKVMKDLDRLVRISLSPVVVQARLHKTRKTIKNILYLDQVSKALSTEQKNFLNTVEVLIGELHDKQNLLDSLAGKSEQVSVDVHALERKDLSKIRQLSKAFYAKAT